MRSHQKDYFVILLFHQGRNERLLHRFLYSDNNTLIVRVRSSLHTYFVKNEELGCLQSILNNLNQRFERYVANHRLSYQY